MVTPFMSSGHVYPLYTCLSLHMTPSFPLMIPFYFHHMHIYVLNSRLYKRKYVVYVLVTRQNLKIHLEKDSLLRPQCRKGNRNIPCSAIAINRGEQWSRSRRRLSGGSSRQSRVAEIFISTKQRRCPRGPRIVIAPDVKPQNHSSS